MSRLPFLALALALACSIPAAAQSDFWLDGLGRVYTIDSFSRIAIDGRSTGWTPGREQLDLLVTPEGEAIYTDSYGRLCRNGSELGMSWMRPHYFKVDGEGNIYTVKDWVDDSIARNGSDTGYKLQKGAGFIVSRDGTLYYRSGDEGNLFVNGRDTGHKLDRDDCRVGPDGGLYFVNSFPHQNRHVLYRYDVGTGETQQVSYLASRNAWAFDLRGNLWIADQGWSVLKNGRPTGWRSLVIQLDGAGNCYTMTSEGNIARNGQNTGWTAHGTMKVAANGDVVYIANLASGELFKNGKALGISASQGKLVD